MQWQSLGKLRARGEKIKVGSRALGDTPSVGTPYRGEELFPFSLVDETPGFLHGSAGKVRAILAWFPKESETPTESRRQLFR